MTTILIWAAYAAVLVAVARLSRGRDMLLPGKVSVLVQALAYVATYVSAVALVGFAGLCYQWGLQMVMIAAGNMWLGTWFVYRFLAWPTRLWQRKLRAKTPAKMLSIATGSPGIKIYLGLLSSILLVVYASAVFKGAAIMMAGALPVSQNIALWALVALVAVSVSWGGLRGVLFTEALQGGIMVLGAVALLVATFRAIGGPFEGISALAELAPTPQANNGFTALSSGQGGLFILSLVMVTSIGVWAQPQLVQRHFALKSMKESRRIAPFAMLAIAVVVGGTYFAGAFSRLILGPEAGPVDGIIPMLVTRLLPEAGAQLFALAIISASLSTASALMHIVAAGFGHDVLNRDLKGLEWQILVALCAIASGVFATRNLQIIAIICTTSWTIIAAAMLAPYLALLAIGDRLSKAAVWSSSLGGLGSSMLWYAAGYAPTSKVILNMAAPGILGSLHPFFVSIPLSLLIMVVMTAPEWMGARELGVNRE
jgi:Na+/pantothenate symporter